MTHDELTQLIEKIALDFVMIESSDTDELHLILSRFRDMKIWADENNQPVLEHALEHLIRMVTTSLGTSDDLPESVHEIIGESISIIQKHARNDYDFSRAKFPVDTPDMENGEMLSEPETKQAGDIDITSVPPEPSEQPPPEIPHGLKHPDALPSHLDMDLFAEFLSLQPAILDKMESLTLLFEQSDSPEALTELKGMLHTLKGEAGFLNLKDVANLCHITEDLLESGSSERPADLLFSVVDWIRHAFGWYKGDFTNPPPSVNDILTPIHDAIETASSGDLNADAVTSDGTGLLPRLYGPDTWDHTSTAPFLTAIANRIEAQVQALRSNPDSRELFSSFFTSLCCLSTFLDMAGYSSQHDRLQPLITQVITRAPISEPKIQDLISSTQAVTKEIDHTQHPAKKGGGQHPTKNNVAQAVPEPTPLSNATPVPPKPDSPTATQSSQKPVKDSILVDTERLDKIIDMIGELVIAESMVIQSEEIQAIESQEINRHLNQMDKITRGLQEAGLSLRMVPIRSAFQKIARLIRDISKKSGKSIQCFMQGEDTELDKTVIDKIGEPLLHLIRNAMDHGIEDSSEERLALDKPAKGTIGIKAYHKSGNIQIEIEDDGQGINRSAILDKARKKGLVAEDAILPDQDIVNLIFEPGFSTAREITDLSGRGVGMNVVKSAIEGLHGQIDVKSVEGKGSIFILKIPLTLAIIDGMIVRSGHERFIIPTLSIVTSNPIDAKNVTNVVNHGQLINVQGSLIPLYRLSTLLRSDDNGHADEPLLMVVVESGQRRIAIGVDELLGKQQIVIKSLGGHLKNIQGISGAAIMPDGKVGLIVDTDKLTRAQGIEALPA